MYMDKTRTFSHQFAIVKSILIVTPTVKVKESKDFRGLGFLEKFNKLICQGINFRLLSKSEDFDT